MQRIERYGVIALVLLLVTIAAVSFWDDGAAAVTDNAAAQEGDRVATVRDVEPKQARRSKDSGGVDPRGLPATGRAPSGGSAQKTKAWRSAADRDAQAVAKGSEPPSTTSHSAEARKSAFETLAANVVERGGALASRGYDRDETGRRYGDRASQEVEFPELPPRPTPAPAARERGSDTPYLPAAKASTAERPAGARSSTTYVVKPGDTLSEIASKLLGSAKRWPEIQALNGGLEPSSIHVGMELKLPGGATGPSGGSLSVLTTRESKEIPPRAPDGTYYTVKKGDMLSQIALDHLGQASRWTEIASLNPGLDPNVLIEGRRLRLPQAASASAPVSATPPAYQASYVPQANKRNRVR